MNLVTVIEAVKTRCPSFGGRVAGAAQFQVLPESANLSMPAAYVIPLDDNPEPNRSQTGYRQTIREAFAVVVALSNVSDERGQSAATSLHSIRAELWASLLGWEPGAEYDGVEYEGGNLLHLDRARMYYQFEFAADMEIGSEQTWKNTELGGLADFTEARIQIDAIDPHDPNVGASGPDGRIEADAIVPIPQT